ncbi:MAG: hypothetical protein HYV16_13605 [Gammaproteobacteria bacterium]|nr:hypothetical protein [Gammaproteobacteria bacterium]
MFRLSEKLFSHLGVVRPRESALMFDPALPQGWIQTRTYYGPDRRLGERRGGVERRETPRSGLNWWRSADRRAALDRRQPAAN